MRIAVVGGTGTAGRQVVREALGRGHEVVVVSRRPPREGTEIQEATQARADLFTGEGLDVALEGAEVVVDVTNSPSPRGRAAARYFATAGERLGAAAARVRVGHRVVLSIVGINLVSIGYYRAKLLQESVVLASPVPATVLRSTQFHEFPSQILPLVRRGRLAVVPRMLTQTVSSGEVATALIDAVEAGPAGRVTDMGGPEAAQLADLVRRVLVARGQQVLILEVPWPGAAGEAMAAGGLLLPGEGRRGRITFEEWLSTQVR